MKSSLITIGFILSVLLIGCGASKNFGDVTSQNNSTTVGLGEKVCVTPNLTEDEIKNMSDEDFNYYGILSADGLLNDVDSKNTHRDEYNLNDKRRYCHIGEYAHKSAGNLSEAEQIVAEELSKVSKELEMNTYYNIRLIGENNEYWLFLADHDYLGEFADVDVMIVFNKAYYDAESEKMNFALNEENIIHFFSVCNREEMTKGESCIGEFVNRIGDDFEFCRYYITISYGDYGVYDYAYLGKKSWIIYQDGRVMRKKNEPSYYRERKIIYPDGRRQQGE